jgi:hypothetical protein
MGEIKDARLVKGWLLVHQDCLWPKGNDRKLPADDASVEWLMNMFRMGGKK